MLPSIFSENLFDDFFGDSFEKNFFGEHNPLYGKRAKNLMKTDVKETESGYEVAVDLPGFKKDEVNVELNDGYLTISAAKGLDRDERGIRRAVTSARSAIAGHAAGVFTWAM